MPEGWSRDGPHSMVPVKDCPRCQPPTGGWKPLKETTVIVPTGTHGTHVVHVASSDKERDVFHTIRCLKDEAAKIARQERAVAHAALLAERAALPPPPPPPDPMLDQDAQRALLVDLMAERKRMRAVEEEFREKSERVREMKRLAVRPFTRERLLLNGPLDRWRLTARCSCRCAERGARGLAGAAARRPAPHDRRAGRGTAHRRRLSGD
jgi:hypothetical protein